MKAKREKAEALKALIKKMEYNWDLSMHDDSAIDVIISIEGAFDITSLYIDEDGQEVPIERKDILRIAEMLLQQKNSNRLNSVLGDILHELADIKTFL